MKKVFVNGYGSIGSRVTSFIKDDPEVQVIGVGKYSPDKDVTLAISRGLKVYVPEKKMGIEVKRDEKSKYTGNYVIEIEFE